MLIGRINEVLRHDMATHLQTSDIAIETTAHIGTRKTTSRTQFTRDETPMHLKHIENRVLNTPFGRFRTHTASIVIEIRPPFSTNESRFLIEKLAIHATSIRHHLPFPFPQWPIPSTIRKDNIAAILIHHILSRKTTDATIQQRQKSHLMNIFD